MAIGWIVAISKPGRETYAAENLRKQQADCYFPKVSEIVTRGPKMQRYKLQRIVPLFPRYLFVHVHDQWRYVLNTYGIAGILMRGEEPLFCPLRTLEELWARQDDEGLIYLPKLERGSPITVVKGPMQGRSGIYQGMAGRERTRVLLDFLNRRVSVLIASDAVQMAA